MCHGLSGSTEARRWSQDVEARIPQRALPIANSYRDQRVQKRGTLWDNLRSEDDATLERRGTAWDNALGKDEGSGGKPQPLYVNDGKPGRLSRRALTLRLGPETVLTKINAEQEDANGVNGDETSVSVSAFSPSGSWKRQDSDGQLKGCPDCMVRRRSPRWVSAPYVSSPDASDSSATTTGGKPTPLREKLRLRNTENSKGAVARNTGKEPKIGGVPMPL